jgi:AraC-like DNA-binding protein
VRAGGPGTDVVVVCGAFVVGEPGHPALRGLPRVLHVPGAGGRTPDWLSPYVDALRVEAFDGGPGSDVVMARLSDAMLARALRHHGDTTDRPGWLAGLRDERLTVAAVATRVGYTSDVAFAAAFRREVGLSPAAWRRAQARPPARPGVRGVGAG